MFTKNKQKHDNFCYFWSEYSSLSFVCPHLYLKHYKQFPLCCPHPFWLVAFSLANLPRQSFAHAPLCLREFTWSQSSNSAHLSFYQDSHPSLVLCLSPHSLSHFPFLLLSNCQAAPGPARHLRHRLLILLDHRKKHVCLWNVQAFLDCDYMAAECVWVCVYVYSCVFPREVIFSPVMNPDGENLFLYPLLLLFSSPSGSDSGVRLCFLLALWFMVVMIYCVWVA